MSGHSKWHSIRHKKAANDAKRGKVLTKHSKLIAVAAKSDPSPETNATLRTLISNAKSDGVPKDNIDRVLKKVSGEGKDAVVYTEVLYEGYAPGGVAVIVQGLTDNINRTHPEVRTAFNKSGANLGAEGSVKFMFDHIGLIVVKTGGKTEDAVFEILMEAGADDFDYGEEETIIFTDFKQLGAVRDALEASGLEISKSEPQYKPKDPQKISAEDQVKLELFIEKIEEVEDVDEIFVAVEWD